MAGGVGLACRHVLAPNIGSADVAAAVAVCAATKSMVLFPVPTSRSEEPEARHPVEFHGDWEILPELGVSSWSPAAVTG
eukprot:SAG11_NODE_25115_length_363_cov_1.337121_1_plen_78_part_01